MAKRNRSILSLAWVTALLLVNAPALAAPATDPPDASSEFTISAPATIGDDDTMDDDDSQEFPQVASVTPLPGGHFIVEWSISTGESELRNAVWRKFDADANPFGARSVISEQVEWNQGFASASYCGDSVFVVWQTDASGVVDVHGRIFDLALAPTTGEFAVTELTDGLQVTPEIACSSDESTVVVVWSSDDIDHDESGIAARAFSPNGTPLDVDQQINVETIYDEDAPTIAPLAGGGFSVVWTHDDYYSVIEPSVVGRILDGAGAPTGDTFPVRIDEDQSDGGSPHIAALPGGGFAVTWSFVDAEATVESGADTDIWLSIHGPLGEAVGAPAQAHQETTHRHSSPDIAVNEDGIITVIWFGPVDEDAEEPDDDLDDDSKADDDTAPVWETSLIGRQFEADGTPRTNPFVIPSGSYQSMSRATIAALSDGRFVVVWEGEVFNHEHGLYGRIIGVGDPVDDDTDDDTTDDDSDDDSADDDSDDDSSDDDGATDSDDDDDDDGGCGC